MVEVAPQEVASDAATAQRVEVLPFAEGGLSVRYTGDVGAWRNTAEFIHGVTDSDPPKANREGDTRVEVSFTVFDVVSDVGLQESVRSNLKVGEAITLGVIGVDVDPCGACASVSTFDMWGDVTEGHPMRDFHSLLPGDCRKTPAVSRRRCWSVWSRLAQLCRLRDGARSSGSCDGSARGRHSASEQATARLAMLRAISLVLLFAALPGVCSAGDPPVLPPLEIPVLAEADAIQVDGDLADWRQIIGPPTLPTR